MDPEYGRLEIRPAISYDKQIGKLRYRIYLLEQRVDELEECLKDSESSSKS